ncbi:MAG: sensor histidine kinase [Spirochaetia bacterium]
MRSPTPHRQLSLRTTQLLLFVGIILAAIALNLVTLHHTRRYFSIFDSNLLGYYSIQRFQSALDANRSALNQYLRSQETSYLRAFYASRTDLQVTQQEVRARNSTSVEAGFEIRGIRRGLIAYFHHADRAIAGIRRGDGPDFAEFVRAGRISDYVFTYMQRLMQARLTEELETHQELRSHASVMAVSSQFGLLGIGILMSVFAALFVRRVTTPIRRLAESAYSMAHGNLEGGEVAVRAHRFSVKEITTLCESFSLMQHNIRNLVDDLKDKAAVERKLHQQELKTMHTEHLLEAARLQGLQAQINPHFLFNALNTVSRSGLFEGAHETTRLIQSLANLLRYHLNTREAVVRLDHELRVVREYVHIQESRFRNRLQFELDCRVNVEEVFVPCFSIQPLVENAVQYGIEPTEDGGLVRVLIREHGTAIRIVVEDTGVGISESRISEIFGETAEVARVRADSREHENPSRSETKSQSAGIGLRNIMDRLHLLYHGEAHISIQRRAAGGTAVTMDIPPHSAAGVASLQLDGDRVTVPDDGEDDV